MIEPKIAGKVWSLSVIVHSSDQIKKLVKKKY